MGKRELPSELGAWLSVLTDPSPAGVRLVRDLLASPLIEGSQPFLLFPSLKSKSSYCPFYITSIIYHLC